MALPLPLWYIIYVLEVIKTELRYFRSSVADAEKLRRKLVIS